MVLASFGCLAWMKREKRMGGMRMLFLAQCKVEKSTDREPTIVLPSCVFLFFSFPIHTVAALPKCDGEETPPLQHAGVCFVAHLENEAFV